MDVYCIENAGPGILYYLVIDNSGSLRTKIFFRRALYIYHLNQRLLKAKEVHIL